MTYHTDIFSCTNLFSCMNKKKMSHIYTSCIMLTNVARKQKNRHRTPHNAPWRHHNVPVGTP